MSAASQGTTGGGWPQLSFTNISIDNTNKSTNTLTNNNGGMGGGMTGDSPSLALPVHPVHPVRLVLQAPLVNLKTRNDDDDEEADKPMMMMGDKPKPSRNP